MPKMKTPTERQREAVRMKLQPGISDAAIGRTLNVARGTVSRWWKLDHVIAYMDEQRATIDAARRPVEEKARSFEELGRLAEDALYKILTGRECFEGESKSGDVYTYPAPPAVVLGAAKTVLSKLRPDLKAMEHTGKDGGPIRTESRESALRGLLQKRLADVAESGGD